jgi:hypothetical protein
MRSNVLALFAVSTFLLLATGCVRTLDGRREAANPLVQDQIVRVYERPVTQCWNAAKEVLGVNGTIYSEDVMQSTVSARVDNKIVRIKVESMDPKMTRVLIQVRTKMGNSDLDLAGEIDTQVALRLATGAAPGSILAPSQPVK